jgi:hypothetical protein
MPREIRFSRPWTLYLNRQSFEPAVVTSTYKPRASLTLYDRVVGLPAGVMPGRAFRRATSVRGIWGQGIGRGGKVPRSCPCPIGDVNGHRWTGLAEKGMKKPALRRASSFFSDDLRGR